MAVKPYLLTFVFGLAVVGTVECTVAERMEKLRKIDKVTEFKEVGEMYTNFQEVLLELPQEPQKSDAEIAAVEKIGIEMMHFHVKLLALCRKMLPGAKNNVETMCYQSYINNMPSYTSSGLRAVIQDEKHKTDKQTDYTSAYDAFHNSLKNDKVDSKQKLKLLTAVMEAGNKLGLCLNGYPFDWQLKDVYDYMDEHVTDEEKQQEDFVGAMLLFPRPEGKISERPAKKKA